jgi:hypothetical protein
MAMKQPGTWAFALILLLAGCDGDGRADAAREFCARIVECEALPTDEEECLQIFGLLAIRAECLSSTCDQLREDMAADVCLVRCLSPGEYGCIDMVTLGFCPQATDGQPFPYFLVVQECTCPSEGVPACSPPVGEARCVCY